MRGNRSGVKKILYTIRLTGKAGLLAQPLTANAGSDATICDGSSTTLNGSATYGSSPYSYSWTPTAGLSDPNVQNPIASPSATTAYTLTVTDNASNTSTDVVVITVNPLPPVNAGGNQTICLGATITFFTTSTGGTYNWTFGDGGTSNTRVSPYAYTAAGTYNVNVIVSDVNGCTATDGAIITVADYPVVNPTSGNTTCSSSCDGNANANASGGFMPFTYNWTGGYTSPAPSSLCAGTYSVTVTNTAGCSSNNVVTVNSPPMIVLDVSPFQTICHGDTALLYADVVSGGVPPFTYLFDSGSSTMSGNDTVYATPVTGTAYTVTVTDNNGCGRNGSTGVSVTPSTDIYGHVTYSGGALSIGTNTAVLYKYVPMYTAFDTIQTTTVDASGDFHFVAADHNDYLVEVLVDTTANPTLARTYYGNQYLWDSATVLHHGCGVNDTISIVMVETSPTVGPGIITGTVSQGAGFSRVPGEPIPGIDVKLGRNPGGQMVASTTTSDPDGTYSFTNIPLNTPGEHYTIYVDIPGLVRDSTRDVTIDATHNTFVEQDYIADSTSVYYIDMTTGITTHKASASAMSVYPNPSNTNTTIEYSIADRTNISLGVYNVLGVKVAELANTEQAAGNYKYIFNAKNYNLKSGIYFISLITDGKATIQRLVITE